MTLLNNHPDNSILSSESSKSLQDASIMIVDDEVEICNFVTAFFQARGFSVYQANNGDEALKIAEEKKPQIILLDVMMKQSEDGFEVLPKIKKILPDSKVIMVTGVEDQASALRGKALGAEDYITKPLVLAYLEGTVIKKIEDLEKKKTS